MKYVKNLKPVLQEEEFANIILQEIRNYEREYYFMMLKFDEDVASESKRIVKEHRDNIDNMIGILSKYLNSVWSIKSMIYSTYAIKSLKNYLQEVVSEISKDHRIMILQQNNIKLENALEAINKDMNKQKKMLDDKHKEEVDQLRKDSTLDKKHLEKTVELLSDVVKKEVVSLKEVVLSRDSELNRLKQENAALLKLTCRLQKKSTSSTPANIF